MKINPQVIDWLQIQYDDCHGVVLVSDDDDAYYSAMVLECRIANLIEFANTRNGVITYRLTPQGEIALGIPATDAPTASAATGERVAAQTLDDLILSYLRMIPDVRSVKNIVAGLYESTDTIFSNAEVSRKIEELLINGQVELHHINGEDYYRYLATPQPATRTPGADSSSGAYTVHEFERAIPGAFPSHEIRNPQGDWVLYADEYRAPIIADAFNTERSTLRQQLAAATSELEAAKAELAECQHAHELASTQRDAATELYSGKHSRLEDVKRELEVSRDARKALEKVIQTAATYLAETNSNDENVGRAYNVLQGFSTPDNTD